ncbi:TNT domain-containing protein [Streptomyces lydicus]|uniref:TNT domain-containing protein n=1 Tax=Streptomyces lydicus TaxID=47763 RepID=UPI003791F433
MRIRRTSVLTALALLLPLTCLAPAPSAGAAPGAAPAVTGAEIPNCYASDPKCRFGPIALPEEESLRKLLVGYQRTGGLGAGKVFLDTYWDPNRKNHEGQVVGGWRYPGGNGCHLDDDGSTGEHRVTVAKNRELDRFGSLRGAYLATGGTPFARRSMPPTALNAPVEYRRFKVLKPFDAYECTTAPYFNQPGGGTQQRLSTAFAEPDPPQEDKDVLRWLVDHQYLKVIEKLP